MMERNIVTKDKADSAKDGATYQPVANSFRVAILPDDFALQISNMQLAAGKDVIMIWLKLASDHFAVSIKFPL